MTLRNRNGETLYPVCNWEKNQHKLHNAHDRAMNALYEEGYSDRAVANLERIERAIEAFDSGVKDGMVYATYKDGLMIKDIIWAYNARH